MPPDPPRRRASFAHYKCLPTTPPPFNLPPNKWPDQLLIACATSDTSRETAQLSKFDFTFHAPQQLKKSLLDPPTSPSSCKISRNKAKKHKIFLFSIRAEWSSWYIEIMETPTATTTTTTTKRFGPSFIIILNKIRVTGEVLERILAPLREFLGMLMYEILTLLTQIVRSLRFFPD